MIDKEWAKREKQKNRERTKLKTLKDMKDIDCPCCGCRPICPKCKTTMWKDYNWFNEDEIKNSAINWVKLGRINPIQALMEIKKENYWLNMARDKDIRFEGASLSWVFHIMSLWVMHFNNITEEDLLEDVLGEEGKNPFPEEYLTESEGGKKDGRSNNKTA